MRMRRARSSVGTCALSKLLSRHKLLVSDQLLSSQNMLGHWIASLLRVSIGLMCLLWPFQDEVILFFSHVSSVLQLCLFWEVSLQFLCYDLNLKQLRMVQKFSSVSLHTVERK